MKTLRPISIIVAFFIFLSRASSPAVSDPLLEGFRTPPEQTKPWCYWYWISDNISKEGITRDLEAMRRIGIGEALIGNIYLSAEYGGNVPAGRVKVLSPEWWDAVEHAIREGGRIGVDIGLFNCPGWSQSGGPWIQSHQTMRYLSASEIKVSGPGNLATNLPAPVEPFQDVALLAFPAPQGENNVLASKRVVLTSSPHATGLERLFDGDLSTHFSLPEGHLVSIDIELPESIAARSLQLVPPAGIPLSLDVDFLADVGTGAFERVRQFRCDWSNRSRAVGFLEQAPAAISFKETKSRRFRLVLSNMNPRQGARLAEIKLSSAAILERYVEKQLGKMHPTPLPMWDSYLWPTPTEPDSKRLSVSVNRVRDLSDRLGAQGVFHWQVPPGEWVIQRIGMTPTGMSNSPSSAEGRGFEVDKMNRDLARHHFDAFIGELLRRMPPHERKALKHVVADSYEMGAQNWTDGFEKPFRKIYGYDPKPWLPVLSGRLVESANQSERFLWDLRRLVADRVATEYVGGLRGACKHRGLELWLENYGHWGFPSEFLKYGRESDRVGGEYWVTGDLGSIECRAAASCANIYGKRFVSAESFTGGPPFRNAPMDLKARGDWAFCEGVNHFVLHVCIHQPWDEKKPGINAPWGTEFNRHNTWFEQSGTWIDYLRRSSWLLQQGSRVADVAYFIGDDAPKMTGVRRPALPEGRDFDYINSDVIENRLGVAGNILRLPHGAQYRVLVLPELPTVRPELLRRIRDLLNRGAVVLGPKPSRSPSLKNYPKCDKEVRELADELWGPADLSSAGERRVGKGYLIWGKTLEEVFASMDLPADFTSSVPLRSTHRRDGSTDIFFVANPKPAAVSAMIAFRAARKTPELWWPNTGTVEKPAAYDRSEKLVRLPLSLPPLGSVFVVFREAAPAVDKQVVSVYKDGELLFDTRATATAENNFSAQIKFEQIEGDKVIGWSHVPGAYRVQCADGATSSFTVSTPETLWISGAWEVAFASPVDAPQKTTFERLLDWSKHPDQRIRNFSGSAHYAQRFEVPADYIGKTGKTRQILDLGDVRSVAVVRLNGRAFGPLWLAPWEVDVTGTLRPGVNELEVEVVNVWNNRLAGDAALPKESRHTTLALPTVSADAPLTASGLLGPVRIYSPVGVDLGVR